MKKEEIFFKLRVTRFISKLYLESLIDKITKPFRKIWIRLDIYLQYRKVEKEFDDSWEKYLEYKKLEQKNEQELRIAQVKSFGIELICELVKTSKYTSVYVEEEWTDEQIEDLRKEFQKNKENLLSIIKKYCDYNVKINPEVESEISNWEFESFQTIEDVNGYLQNLTRDIIDIV